MSSWLCGGDEDTCEPIIGPEDVDRILESLGTNDNKRRLDSKGISPVMSLFS